MDQGIYQAIVDGMTFSYSRLSCFNDCRYQWYLKYIYECEDEDMFYASYGKFIHKLIEKYYNEELSKDELLISFLTGFESEVKGKRPSDDIVQSYIQKGSDYFRNFEPFPFETVAVEKRVEFEIGGYKILGFIDYVGKKDGKYYIVDNKSRDLKPRSNRKKPTLKDQELDSMLKQLYIYSEAIKQEYGEYPVGLCFNCFKSGVFIEEPFNIETHKSVMEWAEKQVNKIRNNTEWYPDLEYFKCRFLCGVHNECCYYN